MDELQKAFDYMVEAGYSPENIPGGIRDTGGKFIDFNNSGKGKHPSEFFVGSYLTAPNGDKVFRIGFGSWSVGPTNGKYPSKTFLVEGNSSKSIVRATYQPPVFRKNDWEKIKAAEAAEVARKTRYVYDKKGRRTLFHSYLQAKGVLSLIGSLDIKVNDMGSLLVPVKNVKTGEWMGFQFIQETHGSEPGFEKRFAKGMETRGGFFLLGNTKSSQTIIVAEGFATGCSLFLATGIPTVVAFMASNLEAVGIGIRHRSPSKKIIFAGDDDALKYELVDRNRFNAGREAAEKAAETVKGIAVFPVFPEGVSGFTDFNDLHLLSGKGSVKSIIDSAVNKLDLNEKNKGVSV